MAKLSVNGFDEAAKELQDLAERARELEGERKVELSELFDHGFLSRETRFQKISELFAAAGVIVEDQEALDNLHSEKLDSFVRSESQFESFDDMVENAGVEYYADRLGF